MEPIKRVSVAELVVSNLKELITSGQFQVGDKVPTEMELCNMLNVSRSTVREALRILQAMGFVEIRPGRGAFVGKIKENDPSDNLEWFAKHGVQYGDFVEVRMAIEPLAAKLAIRRATDKDIDDLKEIYDNLVDAYSKNDTIGIVKSDELFHTQIFKMSKNPLLVSMNEKINEYFTEFRVKVYSDEQGLKNALSPHRRIMEAFIRRDIEDGEAEMRNHINSIMQDVSDALKRTN